MVKTAFMLLMYEFEIDDSERCWLGNDNAAARTKVLSNRNERVT